MLLQFRRRLRGSDHQLPPTAVSTRGREICCAHEPPHLKEAFVLLEPCPILNATEVTVFIIVQDRRDFRRSSVWIIEVPASGSSSLADNRVEGCLLRDRIDLRDFSRVQECICGTTERGTDIESEDKFSRGAGVRCAGHGGTATML